MDYHEEYAEEYTRPERVRLVLLGLLAAGVILLFWQYWALPRWVEFAETSYCYDFWGVSGLDVFAYALFVGIPLSTALVVACAISWRGLRILRDKQVPYRGEKVFKPTRIKRGARAKLAGFGHILAPAPFIAIALWGTAQAEGLRTGFAGKNFDFSVCETSGEPQSTARPPLDAAQWAWLHRGEGRDG